MTSTTTFPCQQCGGAAVAVAGREYLQCEYCKSLVFLSKTPLSTDRIVPLSGQINASCPSCSMGLEKGSIEGLHVLYCGGCYGILLRNEDFGTIVRQRRARRHGCETEACQPIDTAQYDRQIDCPGCHGRMEVHPYYGPGNIVIDSCHTCEYIWLDHGELRTVERVSGGRELAPLPLHINADGEVTIIPEPSSGRPSIHSETGSLGIIADAIFG